MHTTEYLKAQWEAAKDALAAEQNFELRAREEYHAALCADLLAEFAAMGGVIGVTRVRACKYFETDKPEMRKGPFYVSGSTVSYGGVRFTLTKIKRDGTASKASPGQEPERVFILPEDN